MHTTRIWKIAATVAAFIPIGFFLLFAIGEGLGGWSHYLQALIPTALVLFSWRYPRAGGALLITIAVLLGSAYAITGSNQALTTIVLVELLAFVPALASGVLFLIAARRNVHN